MYTIARAAELTGVAPSSLRAWERRYGVPATTRSAGGYRLYDAQALETARRMAQLIATGMRAGDAAALVRGERGGVVPATPAEFVAAVASGAPLDELERSLAASAAAQPFAAYVDDWLMPMLHGLGEAWRGGEVSIDGEHGVSALVLRRTYALWREFPTGPTGLPILVGLPAGARHEVGPLAFATLLRREGARVHYLGPDLPADAFATAVHHHGPCLVVTAAHLPADVPEADAVIAAARRAGAVLVALGGGRQDEVSGVALRLGHHFGTAVTRLLSLVR